MRYDVLVQSISDIPNKEHFAIILGRSTHIPGDERSRTNPGHGYPASTEYSIEYYLFFDQTNLKNAIKELNAENQPFKLIQVKPLTVNIETHRNAYSY